MAVVPGASVREPGRAGDARLWRAWLAGVLFSAWPDWFFPRGHVAVRELVLYPLAEVAAIAAIVVGVRRYRPVAPAAWLLIAAGFFSYWIGDVLWGVYVVQGRDPIPSPADGFYLAGHPTLRLHRYLRERGEPYRIAFIFDPVCWTKVPEQFATLSRQRRRWQRGLWQGLRRHASCSRTRGAGSSVSSRRPTSSSSSS